MTRSLLAPVQHLVDATRGRFAAGLEGAAPRPPIAAERRPVLADAALKAHAAGRPDTGDGKVPGEIPFAPA